MLQGKVATFVDFQIGEIWILEGRGRCCDQRGELESLIEVKLIQHEQNLCGEILGARITNITNPRDQVWVYTDAA